MKKDPLNVVQLQIIFGIIIFLFFVFGLPVISKHQKNKIFDYKIVCIEGEKFEMLPSSNKTWLLKGPIGFCD